MLIVRGSSRKKSAFYLKYQPRKIPKSVTDVPKDGHTKKIIEFLSYKKHTDGERKQWTVYYTSPQSFIIKFSYSLA